MLRECQEDAKRVPKECREIAQRAFHDRVKPVPERLFLIPRYWGQLSLVCHYLRAKHAVRLCLKSAYARQYGVKNWRVRESDQNTHLHGVNWSASPIRSSPFFALSCLRSATFQIAPGTQYIYIIKTKYYQNKILVKSILLNTIRYDAFIL